MKKIIFILFLFLLSCLFKFPSPKEELKFERKDENVRIEGIFDIKGTYKDGFPYHFKSKYYILWLRILNLTPESLSINSCIDFRGKSFYRVQKEKLVDYFKIKESDFIITSIGTFFIGSFIAAFLTSPFLALYLSTGEDLYAVPFLTLSIVAGGWFSITQRERTEREERENIRRIRKYYKDKVPPGYSKIFFVFERVPFDKIVIEYRGKEVGGSFEIMK